MANAPRVTYGQGIARHHGSHLCIAVLCSLFPVPCSLFPKYPELCTSQNPKPL
ncbi:MAG: hypothetical protein F6K50_31660 [Moorea sp. SIO3I7]|uniref:hypothetical protein n=1 Tax=Moorena bouillonii TaxID=207920 RepID=UPI0013016312|nr:hypothetical protein [Moorena bouillonii]NEN99869.1 hypothetical protein [Moorena sp. SIO3I7]NEO61211.1 hypothetical protein [Moorena sp. SIO4G2]